MNTLAQNMFNSITLEKAIEWSEFFNVGYECEDGHIVREVNNETGETTFAI